MTSRKQFGVFKLTENNIILLQEKDKRLRAILFKTHQYFLLNCFHPIDCLGLHADKVLMHRRILLWTELHTHQRDIRKTKTKYMSTCASIHVILFVYHNEFDFKNMGAK